MLTSDYAYSRFAYNSWIVWLEDSSNLTNQISYTMHEYLHSLALALIYLFFLNLKSLFLSFSLYLKRKKLRIESIKLK